MPTAKQLYNFAGATEIDLRQELASMFHGGSFQIPKANKAILRRMRRNADGSLITAPSVDALTNEPDLDTYDPFSLGERYIWDEEFIDIRRVVGRSVDAGLLSKTKFMAGGQLNEWTVIFFAEYFVKPTFYDRIVDLALNDDGTVEVPYRRKRIYRPQSVIDYRSDNGRIEYWGIFCSEKDAILYDRDDLKK